MHFGPSPGLRSTPGRRPQKPLVETLERRELLAATMTPFHILFQLPGAASPAASTGPTGMQPDQVRHAYGFDQISFLASGYNQNAGKGQTIAIVDAYDNTKFVNSTDPGFNSSDLHQFDVAFGLPDPPSFTKVSQTGTSSLPGTDPASLTGNDWELETALDVEWAHAIAPQANIVLVEANSNNTADLFQAVSTAANTPGVSVISMSWGGGESSGETSSDSTFLAPGVTFIASSGDTGAPISYPAASPNVLSVGGTTLNLNGDNTIASETGWSGSGGGISSYEARPAYQPSTYSNGSSTGTSQTRMGPDVAYDADPNTGFPVYDTYNNSSATPWSQVGGTSDAAPQWAGLTAIANQGRAAAGKPALNSDSTNHAANLLYGLSASDYHDITSGTSTGNPNYTAGSGYDLVTGRGSPLANQVVADLGAAATTPQPATHFSISAPASAVPGAPFTVTVTALDANGNATSDYSGTVHFTSSDTQASLPADVTLTGGTGRFTVTLQTLGTQSITATDTTSPTITGSAQVNVQTTQVYSATDTPQPIGGLFTTVSTITINQDVTIADLDVRLNITYPYDGDLYIYLQSPSGTQVVLSNYEGTGANFGTSTQDTTFDSEAAVPISSGSAPFAGSYRPDGALTVYNNLDARGTWTLNVADGGIPGFLLNSGTLNSWALLITPSSSPPIGPAAAPASATEPSVAVGASVSGTVALGSLPMKFNAAVSVPAPASLASAPPPITLDRPAATLGDTAVKPRAIDQYFAYLGGHHETRQEAAPVSTRRAEHSTAAV